MKRLKAVFVMGAVLALSAVTGLNVNHAAAFGFPDAYSRPIGLPSPAPRVGNMFTVIHTVGNKGTANATNVVLTINPINDPNVTLVSVSSIRPCSGTAPIVCNIGTLGTSGGIIPVYVRYVASTAGSYATDQSVTSDVDSNMANNDVSATVTVTN